MGKTAPAPQHPLRRWRFFKENYGDCDETRKIERKHPSLFRSFKKPVEVERKDEVRLRWHQIIIEKIKKVFKYFLLMD